MSLIFYNCEKDDNTANIETETIGNNKVKKISFSEFQSSLSNSREFDKFPVKSKHSKNQGLELPYISTENVVFVETDSTRHYTFNIVAEKINTEFYNLTVETTASGEIVAFFVLKYEPSDNWLLDTTLPFNGLASLENNMFTIEDINANLFRPITTCATDIFIYWTCEFNNPHSPTNASCQADDFTYVLVTEWGSCDSGNGGDSDSGSPIAVGEYSINNCTNCGGNSGGNGTLDNNTNTPINTQPLVVAPLDNIILCLSGNVTPDNSDAIQDVITCLSNSETPRSQINDLNNYLTDNSCSATAQSFALEAALALCDGGEIDLPNKVILDSTFINNQKVKCVYDKLKGLSSTIFNDIINDHFDSAKNTKLEYKVGTTSNNQDGETRALFNINDENSRYLIILDSNFVQNASTIEIALTLIHESIHAELIERCVRLGLISNIAYVFNQGSTFEFYNSSTIFSIESAIFNQLLIQYNAASGGDWNHQFFNALSYRTKMAQNLINIHPWLNDIDNDFLTNINNDPFVASGPYTLNDLMNYLSWIGLENTDAYINEISNVTLELSKKVYVETAVKSKYTNNCN